MDVARNNGRGKQIIITIIGSLNVDLVTYTSRVPNAGETITSESFTSGWGGKGANQAVAAAKLAKPSYSRVPPALRVSFVGAVGGDEFGRNMKKALDQQGVDTSNVSIIQGESTGVAVIIVSFPLKHRNSSASLTSLHI